jgi:cysteine desulfurase / selenocysteine lyase
MSSWNIDQIRGDFPILHQDINTCPLVYFDNAATTQKPRQVIEAVTSYYAHDNANVHRGVHQLSVRATDAYEAARRKVASWIHAPKVEECIFVRGTTEAINLVANSYFLPRLQPGDEIVLSQMEHHANIVPWQMVCQKTGAMIKVIPISAAGEIDLVAYEKMLSPKTKCVSIGYASNALGTINPIKKMVEMAHQVGAKVVVDGAQSTAHLPINVQDLGVDFYAFSGHKMYAPTGIGVLWGRAALLNEMTPYQGGGEMIAYVTFEKTEYAPIPNKFEAGTPHIAGAIGLGAAIDYLSSMDFARMQAYEESLLNYATEALKQIPGYRIIGTATNKVPVISFIHERIHAHDIGTILDTMGIAIRSGHHCAMPVMDFYDIAATARMSFSFYNTQEEIDACILGLHKVIEVFG